MCNLEGMYNVFKDGVRECVLCEFEGILLGHSIFVALIQPCSLFFKCLCGGF